MYLVQVAKNTYATCENEIRAEEQSKRDGARGRIACAHLV